MNEEIKNQKRELINNIAHYMKFGGANDASDPDYDPNFDAGYSQEQVDRCSEILDTFLHALEQIVEPNLSQGIMNAVKKTVLELNELNNGCDGCMIETDQREQICEIIISAASAAGLVSSEDDITEEWRDW